MFFLSMSRKEVAEILREEGRAAPIREYNTLLDSLKSSVNLLIYRNTIPEYSAVGSSFSPLSFNTLMNWSERDWQKLFKRFKDENWLIVWVARGAFILLDVLENHLDDYTWTYIKPKTNVKPHEDESIFDEYTDELLDEKFSKFEGEEIHVLYVDDIILDDYESNVDYVQEFITTKAEEYNIEVVERVVLALLTRTTSVSGMPVYGTLISYQGGILTDWGNDSPDRFDFNDFSETKEYIDDL
ncbi:MAG: hypothetical protein ACFFD1_15045 [Candidatus Thorarchaeota archaeon]